MKRTIFSSQRGLIIFLLAGFFLWALSFLSSNYLLAAAAIAFIFSILLFFLKPIFGLYLMALLLPLTGLALSYRGLELPLIDLLSLIVLSSFSLKHLYLAFFAPTREQLKFPAGIFFLLFFLATLLSSGLNDETWSHLWYAVRWILFFYLAFVVLPFNLIKEEKVLKRSLILVSVGGLAVALMGFVSLFLQDWSDSFFRVKPWPIFGQWIFGENYNLLSEFLVMSGFLVLSLKYWSKSLKLNRLINALAVFMLAVGFLTFGRTAWISISLQVIAYFSIYYFVIKKRKLSWSVALFSLFLFLLLLSPFFVKMLSLQEANFSSTQNRTLLTRISWEAFKQKPFFGYGSGSFVSLVSDNTRFVAKYGDPLDSHGFGQKVLAENGLIGLLLFGLFLFFIFKPIFKAGFKYHSDYKLLLPLLLSSTGVFFYQLFNTSYYKGRVWLPIALALVAADLIRRKREVKETIWKKEE